MKKFLMGGLFLLTTSFLLAQTNIDNVINIKEVERIEGNLSSDNMRGRKIFTPDIDRAADFIANESKINGELLGSQGKAQNIGGYYQPNPALTDKAMRPSETFNSILSKLA